MSEIVYKLYGVTPTSDKLLKFESVLIMTVENPDVIYEYLRNCSEVREYERNGSCDLRSTNFDQPKLDGDFPQTTRFYEVRKCHEESSVVLAVWESYFEFARFINDRRMDSGYYESKHKISKKLYLIFRKPLDKKKMCLIATAGSKDDVKRFMNSHFATFSYTDELDSKEIDVYTAEDPTIPFEEWCDYYVESVEYASYE